MTRLTNEMRDDMIAACVNATFKARVAAYDASRVAFADDLYAATCGDAEKIAKKLPVGWCSQHRNVVISCDGFKQGWNNRSYEYPLADFKTSKDHLFPSTMTGQFNVTKDHAFYDRAQAIAKEFHAIAAAKAELKETLYSLLYSCATLGKLAEAWPAGAAYFPKVAPRVAAVVPVGVVAKVNKLMGIA